MWLGRRAEGRGAATCYAFRVGMFVCLTNEHTSAHALRVKGRSSKNKLYLYPYRILYRSTFISYRGDRDVQIRSGLFLCDGGSVCSLDARAFCPVFHQQVGALRCSKRVK